MGFHHVGQADLELLTSGDPTALASQNGAGITGMSHCDQPLILFFSDFCFILFVILATLGKQFSNFFVSRSLYKS